MTLVGGKGKSHIHYTTPPWFTDLVVQVAPIALDPCSNSASTVPAVWKLDGKKAWRGGEYYPQVDGDGLTHDWTASVGVGSLVFKNPPYKNGAIDKWIVKTVLEAARGVPVLALLANRPSAKWYQKVMHTAQAICVWGPGRIQFGNPPPPEKCEACEGTGDRLEVRQCPSCHGTGFAPIKKTSSSVESLVAYWGPGPTKFRFMEVFEPHGYCFVLPQPLQGVTAR